MRFEGVVYAGTWYSFISELILKPSVLLNRSHRAILCAMKTHKDWFVAIHEAGHVVAQILFEEVIPEGFDYVTIEPGDDNVGHIKLNERLSRIDPGLFEFDFGDDLNRKLAGLSQLELEARLCASLAGEAATYIETGRRDNVGSGRDLWRGDFANCMEYIMRFFSVGADLESAENLAAHHYLEALYWRTVCLLNRPLWWQQVTRIAEALIEKRTLKADQCQQVVNELMEQHGTSTTK